MYLKLITCLTFLNMLTVICAAQKRPVIIDQDGSGPGGSNQMAMIALLQSPDADVLGITIVTGNAWRDEEVQHTLRMLELIKRTDVPVVPGAVFPLVRTQEETELDMQRYGKAAWLGAWGGRIEDFTSSMHNVSEKKTEKVFTPYEIPPMPEGNPSTQPLEEDAAHFLIRQVHAHPGGVTIFAGGPLTNIALAISIDPHFAEMTRGLVIMGGSLNPHTDDPEFATSPRHEFNFWFDPESAHIVLRARWPRIDVTTVDISIKTKFTDEMYNEISHSKTPAALYIKNYTKDRFYMWDELAACAWLEQDIITHSNDVYMDVDISHGPSYGNTLTWDDANKPVTNVRKVHVQKDLDLKKFTDLFVRLITLH